MSGPVVIELRAPIELQRAHDLLHAVVTGELERVVIEPDHQRHIIVALDVLCWVLRHDHATTFAENLERLRAAIAEAGYRENFRPVIFDVTKARIQ